MAADLEACTARHAEVSSSAGTQTLSHAFDDAGDLVAPEVVDGQFEGSASCDPYESDEVHERYASRALFMENEDALAAVPSYVMLFSLAELGLLYILERAPHLTRAAALRLAAGRGVSEANAHEVIDFHFSRLPRIAPTQSRAQGKKKREAGDPMTHALGEAEQIACALPLKGRDRAEVREDFVAELVQAWPMLDVRGELAHMAQWLEANVEKRKTARGMRRFINAWLARAHEREQVRRQVIGVEKQGRNGFGAGEVAGEHTREITDDGLGDFVG